MNNNYFVMYRMFIYASLTFKHHILVLVLSVSSDHQVDILGPLLVHIPQVGNHWFKWLYIRMPSNAAMIHEAVKICHTTPIIFTGGRSSTIKKSSVHSHPSAAGTFHSYRPTISV